MDFVYIYNFFYLFFFLKAYEAASKVVKDEEAVKQRLCEDLNSLVLIFDNGQLPFSSL